jgi:cysteinyl-tRNA synthetase
MSRSLLGPEIDVHTGGEDHISTHHNNEIAQSEAITRRPFVHYWMHNAFLNMDGEKISKSLGNVFYLSDVIERGYHPLALRYFFLQAHYRSPLAFSWDALAASNEGLNRLWRLCADIKKLAKGESMDSDAQREIRSFLRDDLGTPQAIGYLWNTLKNDEYSAREHLGVIEAAESVLGLLLTNPPVNPTLQASELPSALQELAKNREIARKNKDYKESDRLRDEIEKSGYRVEDSVKEPLFTKIGQ